MNPISFLSKNFKLSPSYITTAALSTGIVANDLVINKEPTKNFVVGTFFFMISIGLSRQNFHGYKRAVGLMQEYGYQDRLFDLYTKTFCGRKQVELAAKETGFEQVQKLHFKKNYKWYRFNLLETTFMAAELIKLHMVFSTLFLQANMEFSKNNPCSFNPFDN